MYNLILNYDHKCNDPYNSDFSVLGFSARNCLLLTSANFSWQSFSSIVHCLVFCLFALSAPVEAQEAKKGNSILILPGFSYNTYETSVIPPAKQLSVTAGLEHLTRINFNHEMVIGVQRQWNRSKSDLPDSAIDGYYLSWRYHILGMSIPPQYSVFLDLSMGIFDSTSQEYDKLRTGSMMIGLGGSVKYLDRTFFMLAIRMRSLQFTLNNQKDTQMLDSMMMHFGFGYRYLSW